MSSLFDRLNLRPHERRLVVAVGIILFVVVNVLLVFPLFQDWNIVRGQRENAQRTLEKYRKEIARVPTLQTRLAELQNAGPTVIAEEQDLDLQLTVQKQSLATGLNVTRYDPRVRSSNTQTNQFFDEETLNIHIESGDKELVDFLVGVASTNSLIRVQNLNLQPAPGGSKLAGSMTLVASYQRKNPVQPIGSPAGSSKMAVTNAAKTAGFSGARPGKTNLAKTK